MPTPETTGAIGGTGNNRPQAFDDEGQAFNTKVDPFLEVGLTGLRRSAGHIQEEFLPQLAGYRAHQMYREMRDNDPVIGAILFAIDRLIRQVSWRVEARSPKQADQDAAHFLETCMHDMSMSWEDLISETHPKFRQASVANVIGQHHARHPHGQHSMRKHARITGHFGRKQFIRMHWIVVA